MATLAQFRSRVQAKIGLDATASGTDEVLLDSWINEGVTDFLLQTQCKVISATMTMIVGTSDYTLDTAILVIKDVYITSGSDLTGLEQWSPYELLARRRANTTQSSPATAYAVMGGNLFLVYPTPSAADVITLYYVPRPVTLSAGGDTPSEIPVEFHKAVEYYALAQAADYDDDASSAQGLRYRDLYLSEVGKARKYLNVKGNARLPRAVVGRRRLVSPRNDVYPEW
jgi:hypothetical protein